MSEIVFGDGPKARRFQLRLTHKGVRIAESKIGNRALWTVAQQGGEMPIGVAMEVVAAAMLPSTPNASVALVEGLLDKQPEMTFEVIRAALASILEFYQRITPKKEDDDADPTDPQSENPNP